MEGRYTDRKARKLDILVIAMMILLLILSVAGAAVLGITRDAYAMTNSVIGISIQAFQLILMICVAFSSYRQERSTGLFIRMLISTFLATFCTTCAYETNGLEAYSVFLRISDALSYAFGAAYWTFLWLYMRGPITHTEKRNAHDYGVIIGMSIYALVHLLDIFFGIFSYVEKGWLAYSSYWYTGYIPTVAFFLAFFVRIFHSELSRKEKWVFSGCIMVPSIVFLMFELSELFGEAPMPDSLSLLACNISMYLFFFNQYYERGRKLLLAEMELTKSRLNTMILQMNPHFVYNTLGSIEYLCDRDPATAKKMLNDFTRYLRSGSANLTDHPMIPFAQELENLKAYLHIEQVRFPNLQVEFDIAAENFLLPCLSVQPLVENAVKHGIGKRRGHAGTVTVRTEELSDCWRITVLDDGVGYTGIPQDDRSHIGIENVRGRLDILCGGTLMIRGKAWEGTVAEICIPKKGEAAYDRALRG